MSNLQAPRGTQDIFGTKMLTLQKILKHIDIFAHRYHLEKIQTPEFEHTEVFDRGNDSSDVVNKEMYTFEDRGGRSLTLQPEGTAGVVRAYVQHKLYAQPEPLHRYYYICPVFRYERPQKGRLRIHHQFGVEWLGLKDPVVDASLISFAVEFIKSFGLDHLVVHLNTLGDDASRQAHREALTEHFKPHLDELCGDCQRRYQQNPLRILDCKVDADKPAVQAAPKLQAYLTEESQQYFDKVLQTLKGLDIPYVIDPALVRGLDYYTHTVFEVKDHSESLGSQNTLIGGGRYDNLVGQLGGPDLSSIGFGLGLERFGIILGEEETQEPLDIYGITLGDTQIEMLKLIEQLRSMGYRCDLNLESRSLKAQFKSADRLQARYLLILGEDELKQQKIQLKHVESQSQETKTLTEVLTYFKEMERGTK